MSTIQALNRTIVALALGLASLPVLAGPLDGYWVGIFDVAANPQFVHTQFAEKGKALSGTVDMPANDRKGMPLSAISESQGRVQFDLAGPDGVLHFDGKLSADTVSGQVTVGGKAGTFTLQRSAATTPQNDERFLGAYRFPDQRVVVLSHLGDFPQLFYTDTQTGRYAAMFPAGGNTFFSGAGFLNPTVRETTFRFDTDAAGKATRMVWQAQGQPALSAERIALRSEEVTFKNGDVTLSGTIVLPAGKGPHAAVVLTQMSSPAPRSAYALQAYYFAAHGMAALMFDKRGVGKSGGDWQKATMQDLADDSVAGIKLLAARADIKPNQIGTWGHSQGGWLAPLAAVRSGMGAFVIAQAASGVPPAEQEVFRIENSMRADKFAEPDIAAAVAYERRLMHWVVSGGEGRAELLAAARAGDKARWADRVELVPDTMRAKPREETTAFYRYDPLPDLAKLKAPVLYILGDRDRFVPTAKSAQLFERTLKDAGHKDYQIWMMPNSEHGLWEIPEGAGASAFVNARYWSKTHYPRMTLWLKQHGFATSP
jgi:alpha-beta hydrolase superfamily lysophospholipase